MCEYPHSVGTAFFIKIFLSKNYSFPTTVVDALVDYFFKFTDESLVKLTNEDGTAAGLPVLWHQSLLILVQKYKEFFDDEAKNKLKLVLRVRQHTGITEQIRKALFTTAKTGTEMFD
jgi:essential nuclear protein 1